MVDTVKLVVDLVTAGVVGVQVFGDELEEGTDPNATPAVVVARRGGNPHSEILPLVEDRLQVTVWCGKKKAELAAGFYMAVREVLHGLQGIGGLKQCIEVVGGQSVTDPDTSWAKVESFYQATAVDAVTTFTPLAVKASWGKRAVTDNGDGTFTLDQAVVLSSLLVYKNGLLQALTDDYSLDSSLTVLTITKALNDKLEVYG